MSARRRETARRLVTAFALALATAAVLATEATPPVGVPPVREGFVLRLPKTDAVAFRGVADMDRAGVEHGPMFYPGVGGLAGALVALAAHAAIVDSAKEGQKARQRQAADRVLEPYQGTIAAITHAELMKDGLVRLGTPGVSLVPFDGAGQGWIVESLPVYSMTQDARALVLENAIVVRSARSPLAVTSTHVVKVVSPVVDAEEPLTHWSAEDGRRLREESAEMFAHSMRLLLDAVDAAPADAATEKTVWYREGGTQKSERARLVRQACDRAVIVTLRGWWMSVPLTRRTAPAPVVPAAASGTPEAAASAPAATGGNASAPPSCQTDALYPA